MHHERLLPVSILGFIVNLIGIFVFQHGGHGHSHGSGRISIIFSTASFLLEHPVLQNLAILH